MKKNRTINSIYPALEVDMGGFVVGQPLPIQGLDSIDPFLLIHHADHAYQGDQKAKHLGVGPHPHRGFSPVTFVFKGSVHHQDSMNNSSIVSKGGTQWMNAGKGLIHSERPTKEMAEKGGEMEIIQFWVNSPAKNKMDLPQYLPLSDENTPRVKSSELTDIAVVAGELDGIHGPLKGHSSLKAYRMGFKSGGQYDFAVSDSNNALIYVLNGLIEVNDVKVEGKYMAHLNNDGSELNIKALEDSRFIILAGEPINEKVSSYGPFVMNSQSEIMQALNDYQKGKMGFLVEDFE